MKLRTALATLALGLGAFAFAPVALASEPIPEVEAYFGTEGTVSEELLNADGSESEEFRNGRGRGHGRGHDRWDRNERHDGHGHWGRHDNGRRHDRDGRWDRDRHRPPYPRYPRPMPPRYPYPQPAPQAWLCTAHPIYNAYQVYWGMRSYSHQQARMTALQQCEWTTRAHCMIRGCQLTY